MIIKTYYYVRNTERVPIKNMITANIRPQVELK